MLYAFNQGDKFVLAIAPTDLRANVLARLLGRAVLRVVDLGYGHFPVGHARDEFTKDTILINGIEGFWGLANARLTQFKSLPKHTFHLHFEETEWRCNHRRADKYKCLLHFLRKNPLS